MNSVTEYLAFNIPSRRGFVNITSHVEKIVQKSGIKEGFCLVNAMHITSSMFINDNEIRLHNDYERWLEQHDTRTENHVSDYLLDWISA